MTEDIAEKKRREWHRTVREREAAEAREQYAKDMGFRSWAEFLAARLRASA